MIRWLAIFLIWSGAACAQMSGGAMFPGPGTVHSAGGGVCSEATTFLARANAVTTLDATHTNAYTDLICGLVTDALWTKFDVLFVFATQSSGVALLNIPNSTYTASGGATFTADAGFSNSASSNKIDTTFNPTTASSPNFTQNSAHLSVWSLNSDTSLVQSVNIGATTFSHIFPKFGDGNAYLRVNDASPAGGFAVANPFGLFLGNRDSSTGRQGYQDGVSLGSYGSVASGAPDNAALVAVGMVGFPNDNVVAAISAGGSLTPTDVTNFYNRARTYMTAVGVP